MTKPDPVIIRPIKSDDILAFYGHGLRRTVKGWAVDYNGDLAAICGVTIGRGPVVAFSEIRPGLDVPKITVWRTAKKLMQNIEDQGFKMVFALASPKLPGAPAFLERLGFVHDESSARGEVYKWVIQSQSV